MRTSVTIRRLPAYVFMMVFLVAGFAQRPAMASSGEAEETPKLHVSGEATLDVPADELQLSVSVVTENSDAKAAMDENSLRVTKVIEALKGRGLGEKEYETGRFSINPQYSHRPKDAPVDWAPKIVGYRVENMLYVKTKKMELIGDVIQDAVNAGANSIPSIGFGLSDVRARRDEAIEQATRNAISDAEILARASGVRLKEIVSIQLDEMPFAVPKRMASPRMMMQAAESVAPPIQAGDVTVRARVSIVYEIGGD